jgi:hypothetical protein
MLVHFEGQGVARLGPVKDETRDFVAIFAKDDVAQICAPAARRDSATRRGGFTNDFRGNSARA